VREIEKMGRKCVDSNQLFIDGLKIPVEDRIGEEGRGFEYILHGMNPERILIAAEAVGLGQAALERGRQVRQGTHRLRPPDRPEPGHPAPAGAELDGTRGRLADGDARPPGSTTNGLPCAAEANAAKYLAAEAGFNACQRAMATHGGFGYAKEYHVERYLREMLIPRVAPISPQLILCFIAEKVLGLPKSY
jgi:acyl-CoA dehydrogenase